MDTKIKFCRIAGCDSPLYYLKTELCVYHYNRLRQTGSTDRPNFVRYGHCTVDGCDRQPCWPTSKYCSMHHQRFRKHGTTDNTQLHRTNVTYNGQTQCIAEWAETLGLTPQAMGKRLLNWNDTDRAMTQPGHSRKPYDQYKPAIRTKPKRPTRSQQEITHNDRTQTLAEWADELHMRPVALMRRLDKKPIAEALTPKRYAYGADCLQIHEWAAKLGLSTTAIRFRLKHWPMHHALSKPRGSTGPKLIKVLNYYDPIA